MDEDEDELFNVAESVSHLRVQRKDYDFIVLIAVSGEHDCSKVVTTLVMVYSEDIVSDEKEIKDWLDSKQGEDSKQTRKSYPVKHFNKFCQKKTSNLFSHLIKFCFFVNEEVLVSRHFFVDEV